MDEETKESHSSLKNPDQARLFRRPFPVESALIPAESQHNLSNGSHLWRGIEIMIDQPLS
jgi:hypothetical protein